MYYSVYRCIYCVICITVKYVYTVYIYLLCRCAQEVMDLPDAVEDKVKLQENTPERQDGPHEDTRQRSCIAGLWGHLARNLIGSHRVFNWLKKIKNSNTVGNSV